MLRLLKKSEIEKAKAEDISMERAEGLKIAKRVDALREIQAQEEASLIKFRTSTLSQIHKDCQTEEAKLTALSYQRKELEDDVEDLRAKQHKLLQIPLDTEWDTIDDKHRHLSQMEVAISDRLEVLGKEEEKVKVKWTELFQQETRISLEHKASIKDLKEASEKRQTAELLLANANDKVAEVNEYTEAAQNNILRRETEIAKKEQDLKSFEDKLIAKDIEVNERSRKVNDQYQTLLRTIKRTEKYGNDSKRGVSQR